MQIKNITNSILNADCLEVMRKMPDNCVDLVLTDPPYGINGGSGGTSKARAKSNYSSDFPDTRQYIKDLVLPALEECRRIAKAVVITPGFRNLDLYPQAKSFGCFYQPSACGMQHWGFADSQPILYYGQYYLAGKHPTHCSFQLTERPSCTDHPCSKPIKAWTRLLERSCPEGSIVLDPFLGSGTTAVACELMGRKYIGIELSMEYCDIARKRVQEAKDSMGLFA